LGIPDDAFVIGNVARVDRMKDHATLIDALMTVARSHGSTHFLLAGANVELGTPVFTKLLAAPEMTGRFHLLGVRRDVPDLLAALDLYVQSSAFGEGFPNVVAEAMASAVPAIVTNVGDAALIVDDSDRVVTPRNSLKLAAANENFLSQPWKIRTAIGQRDREKNCQ